MYVTLGLLGALYLVGFVLAAEACYDHMLEAADRRDYRLRESRKYGPEHNYSKRMSEEARKEQGRVNLWFTAALLSPAWPVHALVYVAVHMYWFAVETIDSLKFKG